MRLSRSRFERYENNDRREAFEDVGANIFLFLLVQQRIFFLRSFPPRRAKISHFIPFPFKYNDVFVCSAMEIDEVDDDDVDYNLSPDASGNDICNIGASGDEGGKDELLLKLQQYVTSDANFTRWVYPLFIFFFFFSFFLSYYNDAAL